jgi:hypothetical protein
MLDLIDLYSLADNDGWSTRPRRTNIFREQIRPPKAKQPWRIDGYFGRFST